MNRRANELLDYFINNTGPAIDKWLHYFHVYDKHFHPYRDRDVKILEIGVQNGGSTRMWSNYFGKHAKIVCVDIDPDCKTLEKDGFEVWIGDQESVDFWENFKLYHTDFDIIIDDGGHAMRQQIVSFEMLFPVLKSGGVYLCEDTHTSYFNKLQDAGPKNKNSFVEYAKNLVDLMHGWYYMPLDALNSGNLILNNLESVIFYDSIIVFEKKLKTPPVSMIRGIDKIVQTHGNRAHGFMDLRLLAGVADV